jgi:methyltransferase (TIGR00027 family)
MVCMGRAAAHGQGLVPAFADPTALALLPQEARRRVESYCAGDRRPGLRGRFADGLLARRATMMAVRTVAIDEAVRAAAAPQVVILGAGLDGRAWRMPELRDAVVFEVDHPDSQREKRARAAALAPAARAVHFVPVDFTRDRLDDALAGAGHDPARPTTWIWEGVVMYLALADIEATLGVVASRSAAGSRLIVLYFSPALVLRVVAPIIRRLGEPLRSVFTAPQIQALLGRFGFTAVSDEGLPEVARRLTPAVARAARVMKHLRIVTAERRDAAPPAPG